MAFDPTQIAGLVAWWDASRNQFSDAGATVPATYGGTVQSLVSRDVSAQLAVTAGGATPLLSGGAYDGQAGPGIFITADGQKLITSLSVVMPYTLVAVATGGGSASTQRFVYLGSTTGNWITCSTDLGGVVNMPPGKLMNVSYIPPITQRHCFILTANASVAAVYVDGVNRTTDGTKTGNWGDPLLGGWSPATASLDGSFQHLCVYNSVLSGGNITSLFNYFLSPPLNVVCDGNSLSTGTGVGPTAAYPFLMANAMAPTAPTNVFSNVAVTGQTTVQRTTAAPTAVDPLYNAAAALNVVVMWEVTNDIALGGSTIAQAYAHYQTYGLARKAANPGMKVVFINYAWSDRVAPTAFNALMAPDFTVATSNPHIYEATAGNTYGDMLIDVASITQLQDYTNLTYFQADGIHLTLAGYTIVANTVQTALGILVASSSDGGGAVVSAEALWSGRPRAQRLKLSETAARIRGFRAPRRTK